MLIHNVTVPKPLQKRKNAQKYTVFLYITALFLLCQIKCGIYQKVHHSFTQGLANRLACICVSLQVPQVTDGETTVPWLSSWQEWPLASIISTGYV